MNGVVRTDVSPVREQSAEQKANSLNLRCKKLNRKCKPHPQSKTISLSRSAEKQWLSTKTDNRNGQIKTHISMGINSKKMSCLLCVWTWERGPCHQVHGKGRGQLCGVTSSFCFYRDPRTLIQDARLEQQALLATEPSHRLSIWIALCCVLCYEIGYHSIAQATLELTT